MVDFAILGASVEKLSDKLKNQNHRFIIFFVFVVGAVAYYLLSQNVFVSVLIFVLAPMLLLFQLLAPEYKPEGWLPQWSFYLFLSFVVIAILIIGLALAALAWQGDSDVSQTYEDNWQKVYQEKFVKYNETVTNAVKNEDPSKAFVIVDKLLASDTDMKDFIIAAAIYLEDYQKCRGERCRSGWIHDLFNGRIFAFWANYRCFVASLRGQGYPVNFAEKIQAAYDGNPVVLMARNATDAIGDSLRVCTAVASGAST